MLMTMVLKWYFNNDTKQRVQKIRWRCAGSAHVERAGPLPRLEAEPAPWRIRLGPPGLATETRRASARPQRGPAPAREHLILSSSAAFHKLEPGLSLP